jgi:hypothetical protein
MAPRRSKATLIGWIGWIGIVPIIQRPLELLGCPEVLEVLHVGAVCGLFLEEIIDPSGQQLQMLHPAVRHGPGLTQSSDSVSPEVVESV